MSSSPAKNIQIHVSFMMHLPQIGMEYNLDRWSESHSSEEEAETDWELEGEFESCKNYVRLQHLLT
jgi:hypothetical protein